MKRNRIEEVQKYLAAQGTNMSETSIVDAAIYIARRDGIGGVYSFVEYYRQKHPSEEKDDGRKEKMKNKVKKIDGEEKCQ